MKTMLFHDTTDSDVYLAMITLIPKLAGFCPERYQQEHFLTCMNIILKALKNDSILKLDKEKAIAFTALKDLVKAVKSHGRQESLRMWMRDMMETLAATINNQNILSCSEAIKVI